MLRRREREGGRNEAEGAVVRIKYHGVLGRRDAGNRTRETGKTSRTSSFVSRCIPRSRSRSGFGLERLSCSPAFLVSPLDHPS